MSSRFLVALKAAGTSALKDVGILVALKTTISKNVSSQCCHDFGSSESCGNRVKKVANPSERKMLNVAEPHFSQGGGPIYEGEQCDSLCGGPTSDGNGSYV